MEPKRLYRSLDDRKIAGVAGGLGEYFLIDPLLIRLIFVILLLAGGGGFIIYLVLWIVTPEKPYRMASNQDRTSSMNQPYAGSDPVADNGQEEASSTQYREDFSQTTDNKPSNASKPIKKEKKGSLVGGLVLITLGALFLADELVPQVNFGDLWPLILVAIGIGLLINAMSNRKNEIKN